MRGATWTDDPPSQRIGAGSAPPAEENELYGLRLSRRPEILTQQLRKAELFEDVFSMFTNGRGRIDMCGTGPRR